MSEARKLAAILVADVVRYSRLAGADEDRTLARLRGLRSDLIDPATAAHYGRIVKRTGDGSIVEFRSVVDAVRCAIEMQTGMVERNAGLRRNGGSSFASASMSATLVEGAPVVAMLLRGIGAAVASPLIALYDKSSAFGGAERKGPAQAGGGAWLGQGR